MTANLPQKSKTKKKSRLSNREVMEFLEVMKSVDTKGLFSKLNKTTMTDNNGGRILY